MTTPPKPIPKTATVMGLGRFGGGIGVTRWLADLGCRVTVTDLQHESDLQDGVNALRDLVEDRTVTLRLGEHRLDDFTTPDLVVANPAVPTPWNNPYLAAAREAGVPVTTEIELLLTRLPDPRRVIGITGSAGKSTTTALIAHMLDATLPPPHRAFRGGNIGGSLLTRLNDITPDDWVVLELSSAMLAWLAPLQWSPAIAVITNISPNHLDWHGDFRHYRHSKHLIALFQQCADLLLCPDGLATDEVLKPPLKSAAGVVCTRDENLPRHVRLPGRHNRINAALAGLAADAAFTRTTGHPMPADAFVEAQASFPGLPHRLQVLDDITLAPGISIHAVNDSKCTTPGAAQQAVDAVREAWPDTRIHLIAGGYDKKIDLAPLASAAAGCATVATIGQTGPAIAELLRDTPTTCIEAQTLANAVEAIRRRCTHGDTILLSPACASWDQFTNYEERGNAFMRVVTHGPRVTA